MGTGLAASDPAHHAAAAAAFGAGCAVAQRALAAAGVADIFGGAGRAGAGFVTGIQGRFDCDRFSRDCHDASANDGRAHWRKPPFYEAPAARRRSVADNKDDV